MMIIGLYGLARSGKSTVAGFLEQRGFHEESFARSLKEAAKVIFGFTDDQVYGDSKDTVDEYWGFSPRYALQVLGTEGVRNNLGNDVWIKSLQKRLNNNSPDSLVVISDVRFRNEAEFIKSVGGKVWKIEREGHDGLSGSNAKHASENELVSVSNDFWDAVIRSGDGDLNLLKTQAFDLLEKK